jgi:hypothetical protein
MQSSKAMTTLSTFTVVAGSGSCSMRKEPQRKMIQTKTKTQTKPKTKIKTKTKTKTNGKKLPIPESAISESKRVQGRRWSGNTTGKYI